MKWLALVLVFVLLSGCGLIRNLRKDKHESVESTGVSSTAVRKREASAGLKSSSTDRSKSQTRSQEDVTVYPRPGSSITVNPDGSITAQADSVKRSVNRLTNEAKDIANNISSNLSLSASDRTTADSTHSESNLAASSDSKPSWKPYLWGLGVIALLAIIYAVYRKFNIFKWPF